MVGFSKAMERRLNELQKAYELEQFDDNQQKIIIPKMDRVDISERAILMKAKQSEDYKLEQIAKELAIEYPTTAQQRWMNFLKEAIRKLPS